MTAKYCVDSSVWVDAEVWYHPESPLFREVWAFLAEQAGQGVIVSPEEVYKELLQKSGRPMLSWLKGVKGALFAPSSERVQERYAELVRTYEIVRPDADPRPRADGWVIALAQVEGALVVTHERSKPGAPKKRQIRDICAELGVRCLRLPDLLLELQGLSREPGEEGDGA